LCQRIFPGNPHAGIANQLLQRGCIEKEMPESEQPGVDHASIMDGRVSAQGNRTRPKVDHANQLSNGNIFIQVHILDQIQQFDTIFHGALESFTSGDQT